MGQAANMAWYCANDHQESAEQVAARLFGGNGAGILAVDAAGWEDIGPVVHGAAADGALLVIANPAADSCWRTVGPGGIPVIFGVDAYAPTALARAHMADLRTRATAVPTTVDAAHESHPFVEQELALVWPDAIALRLCPQYVTVHSPQGHCDTTWDSICAAGIDPIAADQFSAHNLVVATVGDRLWQIALGAAEGVAGGPVPIGPQTPVLVLGLDSWGITLVCITDVGPVQLRASFVQQVSSIDGLVPQVELLIAGAPARAA